MKVGVAIFLLILLAIGVILAVASVVRWIVKKRKETHLAAKWYLREIDTEDSTEFYLVKGRTTDFMGRALRKHPDYTERYMELYDEVEQVMIERNSARKITHKLNQKNG